MKINLILMIFLIILIFNCSSNIDSFVKGKDMRIPRISLGVANNECKDRDSLFNGSPCGRFTKKPNSYPNTYSNFSNDKNIILRKSDDYSFSKDKLFMGSNLEPNSDDYSIDNGEFCVLQSSSDNSLFFDKEKCVSKKKYKNYDVIESQDCTGGNDIICGAFGNLEDAKKVCSELDNCNSINTTYYKNTSYVPNLNVNNDKNLKDKFMEVYKSVTGESEIRNNVETNIPNPNNSNNNLATWCLKTTSTYSNEKNSSGNTCYIKKKPFLDDENPYLEKNRFDLNNKRIVNQFKLSSANIISRLTNSIFKPSFIEIDLPVEFNKYYYVKKDKYGIPNNCYDCVNWPGKDGLMGLWNTKTSTCKNYKNGSLQFSFYNPELPENDKTNDKNNARENWVVMDNSSSFWNGLKSKKDVCPNKQPDLGKIHYYSLESLDNKNQKYKFEIKQKDNEHKYYIKIQKIKNTKFDLRYDRNFILKVYE